MDPLTWILIILVGLMISVVVIRLMRRNQTRADGSAAAIAPVRKADGNAKHVVGGIAVIAVISALLALPDGADRAWLGLLLGAGVGLVWVMIAAAIGSAAERKGRSWVSFFWLSMLITPVITAFVVAALAAPETRPRATAAAAAAPKDDPLAALEKLANLRDRGAITDEEYEQKKQQLLDRM